MEQSLSSWVVGAVATGAVAVIAFAVRGFVTEVRADLRQLVATVQTHEGRFQLGNQAFQGLRDQVGQLHEDVRDLQKGIHNVSERVSRLEDTKP